MSWPLAMITPYHRMLVLLTRLEGYSIIICGDREKDTTVEPILARDNICDAISFGTRNWFVLSFFEI